ncbi:hypothetical protein [Lentilactobacillus sp. SPB1-3]|uniref:Uncharacterized protein n=1 Tax=Lentilactobacillus terminaliae TaxID=3003483 RepID=A0ACD5DF57_9LACO|nr:hypothetical protein [Lentilactobacillus sp. SPB1-3]MCZ0976566.1 hypothetical protein [Lentilactobacillus sp. SPB1-3]
MKRKLLPIAIVVLGIILTGCGKANLSVNDSHIQPKGLAAVVQGKTNQKQVTYQIDNSKKKTVKTKNGAFAMVVPAKDRQQTVKIKTSNLCKKVTVAKTVSLGSYAKISGKYNQALIGSAMPKADQKMAQELAVKSAALKKEQVSLKQATPQEQAVKGAAMMKQAAALKQEGAQVQGAMKQAKSKVSDLMLPTKVDNGVSDLLKTKHMTVRGNIQNGKTIGLALMVPVKDLKTAKHAKSFGTSFALLTNSVGANAKKILNDFKKQANSKNKNQTTTNVMKSNGVKFSLGYSTTTLYVYITK